MKYIIYKLEIGPYYYIGYTENQDKRFKTHLRELKKQRHHNSNVQSKFNEEGADNLSFSIISSFETEREARLEEESLIKNAMQTDLRHVLNQSTYSSGGDLISNHTNKDEVLKRRSATIKANASVMTKEERSAVWGKPGILNGMYGKTHTKEVKDKLSATKVGISVNVGIKRSDETKKKMSVIASQRTGSKNPFFGRVHTEDSKERVRSKMVGKTPTNTRKVRCDEIDYPSVTAAAKFYGVTASAMIHRLKSLDKRFSNFVYL